MPLLDWEFILRVYCRLPQRMTPDSSATLKLAGETA